MSSFFFLFSSFFSIFSFFFFIVFIFFIFFHFSFFFIFSFFHFFHFFIFFFICPFFFHFFFIFLFFPIFHFSSFFYHFLSFSFIFFHFLSFSFIFFPEKSTYVLLKQDQRQTRNCQTQGAMDHKTVQTSNRTARAKEERIARDVMKSSRIGTQTGASVSSSSSSSSSSFSASHHHRERHPGGSRWTFPKSGARSRYGRQEQRTEPNHPEGAAPTARVLQPLRLRLPFLLSSTACRVSKARVPASATSPAAPASDVMPRVGKPSPAAT